MHNFSSLPLLLLINIKLNFSYLKLVSVRKWEKVRNRTVAQAHTHSTIL